MLNKRLDGAIISALIYGDDSFGSKIKRFFTFNWIVPINGTKKTGERYLRKLGFTNSEIKTIRASVHKATGEAIDEFGDINEDSEKYDINFTGWLINTTNPASGGTFGESKAKEYIKKRITLILNK